MRLKYILPTLLLLAACGSEDLETEPPADAPQMGPAETIEVTREAGPDSPLAGVELLRSDDVGPSYPNARLTFASPDPGARYDEGETVEVRFSLSGYELSIPTPEGDERGIARAPDGQHLHFIINDRSYQALYDADEPVLLDDLPAGTHILRAFPGRDWHESVKTPGALAQRVIVVGDEEQAYPPAEEWGPALIYSRPQGEYAGTDADSVLVDYVVTNARLSPDGFRVRLTINDEKAFVMSEWAPYLVTGLPDGEHTFRLELLGPDGNPVDAPFHPIERQVQIRR